MMAALLIVPSTVSSAEKPMLELRLGLTQAAFSQQHQPWAIGIGSAVAVTVPVAAKTRLRLGIGWRRLWDDTISAGRVKLPHPDDRAARAWTQTLLKVQALHPLGRAESLGLYGGGGLGLSLWRVESYPGYEIITVADDDGDPADFSATELVASGVIGIAPRFGSHFSFLAEIGVDYLVGIGAKFDKATSDERSRANVTLSFGLAYAFGGSSSTRHHADPYDVAVAQPEFVPLTNDDHTEEQPAADTQATATEVTPTAITPTADSDGDGVINAKDNCDNTPTGAIVNRDGCPLDGDSDGVFDGLDRCPGTPDSLRASVDQHGCPVAGKISTPSESAARAKGKDSVKLSATATNRPPLFQPMDSTMVMADSNAVLDLTGTTPLKAEPKHKTKSPEPDSDRDGVPDSKDWCPNTLRGLKVDRHGCLVMTELQRRLVLHVSYLPGTTAPDATSLAVLRDLVVRLKRSPESLVRVEGFTDNIGRDADNLLVSQKRADRIKAYLVKKGIVKKRITAIGRGESKFIAGNKTAKGRAKNRRIEISFHRE